MKKNIAFFLMTTLFMSFAVSAKAAPADNNGEGSPESDRSSIVV